MKKQRLTMLMTIMAVLIGLAPLHAAAAGAADAKEAPQTVQVDSKPIRLVFDERELALPKGLYAFLYQGRTYIPIRYLSYALLKQVGWDGASNEVTVSEPTKEDLAELKKQLLIASGGKTSAVKQKLTMKVKEAKLVFDGKPKALPKGQSLFVHEGSIYVPLRFLAESIGTKIDWDPATMTVSGKSKAYLASQGDSGQEDDSQETEEGSGAGSGGAGVGGSSGGGGGGGVPVPSKPTYEQITAGAESRLQTLRTGCQATLLDTAMKYSPDADDATKAAIMAELQSELDGCTADFEQIISETSAALTAGGYSTAIIADYRAAFEAELEAGRKLAEAL